MKETNGRGVDVVLNSLAEEKLLASVKCLAVGGRFIEIGLYDFLENNPLSEHDFTFFKFFYEYAPHTISANDSKLLSEYTFHSLIFQTS